MFFGDRSNFTGVFSLKRPAGPVDPWVAFPLPRVSKEPAGRIRRAARCLPSGFGIMFILSKVPLRLVARGRTFFLPPTEYMVK